jgi:hypothetical protein
MRSISTSPRRKHVALGVLVALLALTAAALAAHPLNGHLYVGHVRQAGSDYRARLFRGSVSRGLVFRVSGDGHTMRLRGRTLFSETCAQNGWFADRIEVLVVDGKAKGSTSVLSAPVVRIEPSGKFYGAGSRSFKPRGAPRKAVHYHFSGRFTGSGRTAVGRFSTNGCSSPPFHLTAVAITRGPTAPRTLTATAVSGGEIDLTWGASNDNVGIRGYQVERCQGTGCSNFTQIATPTTTSYKDTTTTANTTYSYRVRAVDSAGNVGPYSNTATRTAISKVSGRLHVDPTGRYLVDQNGRPFLMTGDSPQALIGNLTQSDAALFFSTRRAQGFNTVWINLLCDSYTGCDQDGETWDGIPPFTAPGDLATPNEAYFSRVDQMIRLAAKYGFVVLLDPAETGGWLDTLIANGVDKDRAYGQYLGRRYGAFSNIIWMSGNDYQTWGPDNDPYVTAVAQGIRDTDPSALQTVELNFLRSGSLDDPTWAPLIDLNASYTYDPTYVQLLKDYNRSNFLPTFLVEASYEDEQNSSTVPAGTPQQLRRQEYWSLLSGATGQLFGNHYTWQFLCSQRDADGNCVGGWKDQLASPGATQMAHVVALLSSRPWYELVPDQNHEVVTSGYGSFGGDDYVTAARTPEGKLAIAYVPSARTITVDLGTLSGRVTARWYDPTNGAFAAISGSPFVNHGSVSLTTPGTNSDGADDWVLVLEGS